MNYRLTGKKSRDQLKSWLNQQFDQNSGLNSDQSLQETLLVLLVIRTIILTILIGITAWTIESANLTAVTWISIFIGATYIFSLVNAYCLRKCSCIKHLCLIQIASDILLSSCAVYLVGATGSVILFLLVIIGASFMLGSAGAVTTAAICGICYGIIVTGLVPPIVNIQRPASATEILMVYISLVVVGLSTSAVAKHVNQTRSHARNQEDALSEMTERQTQLFNDLREGIITVDLEEAITSINQAARSIIGLSKLDVGELLGKPLSGILEDWGLNLVEDLMSQEETLTGPAEISLKNSETKPTRHLSYTIKTLKDNAGNNSGKLFVFNDISHIKSIEEKLSLQEKMAQLMSDQRSPEQPGELVRGRVKMIGESPAMGKVFNMVDRVSASDASVLITGESGTGKELIAKAIHIGSHRAKEPFVTVNCGAIPENLIESELFGHVKGAFTGAIRENNGLFRQAEKGTIFLDEIGELPLHLQSKLLRALQERTVRPVGGVKDIEIDVRVLAATNRNLREEATSGKFREDLYYRLNVVNISLPPLRDRTEDIPHLISHFLSNFSSSRGGPPPSVSTDVLQLLMSYSYPGNIRELENIIERAIVLGGNQILPEHLPGEITQKSILNHKALDQDEETLIQILPIDLEGELAKIEKDYLLSALEETGGVKKQAAELLGLNFRSFRYRLKKYGLSEVEEQA